MNGTKMTQPSIFIFSETVHIFHTGIRYSRICIHSNYAKLDVKEDVTKLLVVYYLLSESTRRIWYTFACAWTLFGNVYDSLKLKLLDSTSKFSFCFSYPSTQLNSKSHLSTKNRWNFDFTCLNGFQSLLALPIPSYLIYSLFVVDCTVKKKDRSAAFTLWQIGDRSNGVCDVINQSTIWDRFKISTHI